ncbi:hypothetical protein D3C72_2307840 [compost metagenome]
MAYIEYGILHGQLLGQHIPGLLRRELEPRDGYQGLQPRVGLHLDAFRPFPVPEGYG